MPRARRRFLFLSLAAVTAGLAVAWVVWPRSAITRENAAKIGNGMPLAEVEALLGGPARKDAAENLELDAESDAHAQRLREESLRFRYPSLAKVREWWSNDVIIYVSFDGEERVAEQYSVPVRVVLESPLQVVRRWLRL